MSSLFKIFTIFTPEQIKYCMFILFIMIIGAVFEAVGIGAILPLISIMGEPDFLDKHVKLAEYVSMIGITSHRDFIIFSASVLIVIYMLKNIYMVWQAKIQVNFSSKNQIYYSSRLMANYLNKSYLYHLDHNTATILRNINNAGIIIFSAILLPTFTLLTEITTAFAIWLMLVFVDSFTGIIVAGFMGSLLYFVMKIFRKKITAQGIIQNKYSANYIKWVNQGLGSIKETKVLRKENLFLNEFTDSYTEYGNANKKFLFLNQLPKMIIEALVISGLLLLIVIKLLLGTAPMDIVPLLGVLALAAFRLMPSANRIVALSNGIKFQMPFFNEVYDELILIRDEKNKKEKIALNKLEEKMPFEKELSVEKLSFRYPEGNKDILTDISFKIPKGSFVGIVGPSGAGKTTFVDILLGLLTPKSGAIKIDDVDIQKNIPSWQANLSYVPQSIYLIDGSIKENIALGISFEKIDDSLVEKVLKMADLYDFILSLPNGINTNVGERGVKLSGGQRQRIGIARALYYKPNVLVLDEATSALDNETEKSITDTILKLKGKITIISIAHRVSTLEECDFKIKFEAGKAKIVK